MKRALGIAFSASLLAGCLSNYAVTLNEQPMYEPPPLFSKFRLHDPALDTCVRQHIRDMRVHQPAELTKLSCTHAGISSLAGLELFDHIEQLQLDDNAISDVSPLAAIPRLKQLSLARNSVRNASALKVLINLDQLDLDGNQSLDCSGLAKWPHTRITPPAHCKG